MRGYRVRCFPQRPIRWYLRPSLWVWLVTNKTNRSVGGVAEEVTPHWTVLSEHSGTSLGCSPASTISCLLAFQQQMDSEPSSALSLVSVISLLACSSQVFVAAVLTCMYGRQSSTEDRWILMWLFYDVIIHLTLVRPFRFSWIISAVVIVFV